MGCAILTGARLLSKTAVCDCGVWLSLVEHTVRDREVAGSNPVTPIEHIVPCASRDILDKTDDWSQQVVTQRFDVRFQLPIITAHRIERGRGFPAASFVTD